MTTPSFPPEFPGEPSRPAAPVPPSWPGEPGPAGSLTDRLLEHRIVLALGHLDGARATEVCAKLIALDSAGEEPVALHLRAPDGDLQAAFAVADTIGAMGCPVDVLVAGRTGGPVVVVLTAARRREMMPHATVRLTEPRTRFTGDATDVAVREEEERRLVDAFYIRLAEATGREVDEIREDARNDRLLTAEKAVAYGLVHAITSRP